MAFGMMVNRWTILKAPIQTCLSNASKIFMCITRLHNFCINQKDSDTNIHCNDDSSNETDNWFSSDTTIVDVQGNSVIRYIVTKQIENLCLTRPMHNLIRNS